MVPFARMLSEYENAVGATGYAELVTCADPGDYLAAHLPVFDLAAGSVAAFATAANRVAVGRGLTPRAWHLEPERIAGSFASDRLVRVAGEPVDGFAELSGFFAAADGWVRTHGNYPHHRDRLLRLLDLPPGADRAMVAARIGTLSAADVEERAAAIGAIAVRVRSESEWTADPAGIGAASGDLVTTTISADGALSPTIRSRSSLRVAAEQPLLGVKVLDLTRVIAGPVATRALALLGAQVLRVDPPRIPEIGWQHLDTGQGKRSALLDLREAADLAQFRRLLADADVLVTGYRPGAVERLIGAIHFSGLVHARVCAWGSTGPWADRRGFDSIVQATSGISLIEGAGAPGALPAQALDHATGYLLAAGITDALAARDGDGHGRSVDVSLARTAAWLLGAPGRTDTAAVPTAPTSRVTATHRGVTTARPALAEFGDYPSPALPWGSNLPEWK